MNKTVTSFTVAVVTSIAAQVTAGGPVTYEVAGDYSEGCFGLCLCAIFHMGELDGSFELTPQPTTPGDPVQNFLINNISMAVAGSTVAYEWTGSGSYSIITGIITTHQLVLDLVDERGNELHLDSGMTPGGESFPDIGIGLQHVFVDQCYGSWFSFAAAPADTALVGDLNGDGVVDGFDLGQLLAQWGNCPLDDLIGCSGDLNDDGWIDGLDLGILLSHWTL